MAALGFARDEAADFRGPGARCIRPGGHRYRRSRGRLERLFDLVDPPSLPTETFFDRVGGVGGVVDFPIVARPGIQRAPPAWRARPRDSRPSGTHASQDNNTRTGMPRYRRRHGTCQQPLTGPWAFNEWSCVRSERCAWASSRRRPPPPATTAWAPRSNEPVASDREDHRGSMPAAASCSLHLNRPRRPALAFRHHPSTPSMRQMASAGRGGATYCR